MTEKNVKKSTIRNSGKKVDVIKNKTFSKLTK